MKWERHLCINTKWRNRKKCAETLLFPHEYIDLSIISVLSMLSSALCLYTSRIFKCQTRNDLKRKERKRGEKKRKKKFIKKHYFIFIHKTCIHTHYVCFRKYWDTTFSILEMCLLQTTTQQCMLFRLNKFKFSPLSHSLTLDLLLNDDMMNKLFNDFAS